MVVPLNNLSSISSKAVKLHRIIAYIEQKNSDVFGSAKKAEGYGNGFHSFVE